SRWLPSAAVRACACVLLLPFRPSGTPRSQSNSVGTPLGQHAHLRRVHRKGEFFNNFIYMFLLYKFEIN
ncbi:MAG: hypothetical protein VX113_09055, partial [Pseudomonadota bacterium]|nr:hypothetical protein [Pseudomonadota bacterium]